MIAGNRALGGTPVSPSAAEKSGGRNDAGKKQIPRLRLGMTNSNEAWKEVSLADET